MQGCNTFLKELRRVPLCNCGVSEYLVAGNKKVLLEVGRGSTTTKKNTPSVQERGSMSTGMGQMLSSIRQELANKHGGIFPHAILSSQHISLLCAKRPDTMEQVV